MKPCTRCLIVQESSEFYKDARNRDGLQAHCKACMRAANKDWMSRNAGKNAAREKRRRLAKPGRSSSYVRAWRAANPERSALLNAPSENRRTYDRDRYRDDPKRMESVKRRCKELNKRRPEIKASIVARRRSLQKHAVVLWADKEKILNIYAEARRLSRETGIKHHVDHIVPLQSHLVCGLHWEGNLQALPAAANQHKNNRTWPDMPGVA